MNHVAIDLGELCDRTGVTVRTVRYYVQQGLLPSPGTGPAARYGQEHLDRLRLIRRMQREHLPLAEIRHRLEPLDQGGVHALLQETAARRGDSAADYVRSVLQRAPVTTTTPSPMPLPSPLPPRAPARSQWDRIPLGRDIELHVRRPMSRDDNRRLDRLIDAAHRILNEP